MRQRYLRPAHMMLYAVVSLGLFQGAAVSLAMVQSQEEHTECCMIELSQHRPRIALLPSWPHSLYAVSLYSNSGTSGGAVSFEAFAKAVPVTRGALSLLLICAVSTSGVCFWHATS